MASSPLTSRLILRATTPPLLVVLAAVYAAAHCGVAGLRLWRQDDVIAANGVVAAGDFFAHYTGAEMIRTDGNKLYDFSAQLARQRAHTGAAYAHFHLYINPPGYALGLAPLSAWSLNTALRIFCSLMGLALVAALWLLRPWLHMLQSHWWTTVLLCCGFLPLCWSVSGGQNTALTLLLIAGMCAADQRGRWVLCGVCLGLLSYKPQFIPAFVVLLLAARRWRTLGVAALTWVLHYGIAAVLCGWNWPLVMWQQMGRYQTLDKGSNLHTEVSLLGAAEYACGASGVLIGAAAALGTLAWLWVAARRHRRSAEQPLLWGMATAAAVLSSPHTQFYDTGLVIMPALLAIDWAARCGPLGTRLRGALLAGFIGFAAYQTSATLGFQPLVLWPLLMFIWIARLLDGNQQNASEAQPAVLAANP